MKNSKTSEPIDIEKIFMNYLIDRKKPYKINLPRDLIFEICGQEIHDLIKNEVLDVRWYYDKQYENSPFSLFDVKHQQEQYLKQINEWRRQQIFLNDKEEVNQDANSFKDLLGLACSEKKTLVIGESHNDPLPKALLMNEIDYLAANKAAVFFEGISKHLQTELDESIKNKKPTPLIEFWLQQMKDDYDLGKYSEKNLCELCISKGIPIIACKDSYTDQFTQTSFLTLENCQQISGIERMYQNYDHFNALEYAKKNFPEHTLHICLIGDAHAYTYHRVNDDKDVYPGIVDITNGIYVNVSIP